MLSKKEVYDMESVIIGAVKAGEIPNVIARRLGCHAKHIHEVLMLNNMHVATKERKQGVCKHCLSLFPSHHAYFEQPHILCKQCRATSQEQFRMLGNHPAKHKYIFTLLDKGESINYICDLTGMTRQAIWKMKKRNGIKTPARSVEYTCDACGKVFAKAKSRKDTNHHFCCSECYYSWLSANSFYENDAHGSKVSRDKVKYYFNLQPEHRVHHINGNGLDTDIKNLMVFASQGDHIRYHRQMPGVEPLWDGSKMADVINKGLGEY